MKSKSKLVNVTRQKDARTYNDAVTNSTSLHNVLDLFFIAGASRTMPVDNIVVMLEKAYAEDPLLTIKVIFWAGDIRGGAGERRFFRIALKWLEENYDESLWNNLSKVPYYNRWDSLFHLNSEMVSPLIFEALTKHDGLCAKWMPRKKQYDNFADKFRRKYNIGQKAYRKLIVELSKTVEQQMCNKEWDKIEYSKIPSVAMNKYRTSFYRNDESRFTQYIDNVLEGKEDIKASVIFPYNLYQSYQRGQERKGIEAQWNAMPNYLEGSDERILPVCDVSGSMTWNGGLPLDVSVSLGVYLSERNASVFKDAFVTFSSSPQMHYLQGTVCQRFAQLRNSKGWNMNTDLDKVFQLVLNRAVEENVSPDEMPTMLLIISDMEFDRCGKLTAYENMTKRYEEAGYQIPKIVFWNVNGRVGNVPVSSETKNVALVSGCTPAIMKGVLGGKDFTPVGIMLETLNSERYKDLTL